MTVVDAPVGRKIPTRIDVAVRRSGGREIGSCVHLCGGHAPPAARARALPGTLGIPEARGDGAACPRANQPAHIGGARHRAGGVAVNNGPAVAKLDADESADTGRAVDGPGRITVKDRRREPVAVVIANQAPGILSDTGYVAARIAST